VDIHASEEYNASNFRVNICNSGELVGLNRQVAKKVITQTLNMETTCSSELSFNYRI
jgi:hypothetical protein